jgi:hypothetical protein
VTECRCHYQCVCANADTVTDAMIDAAVTVLSEEYDLGGAADVTRYLPYLGAGMTGQERAAAIAAMRAEDERLYEITRANVRRAVEAALAVRVVEGSPE